MQFVCVPMCFDHFLVIDTTVRTVAWPLIDWHDHHHWQVSALDFKPDTHSCSEASHLWYTSSPIISFIEYHNPMQLRNTSQELRLGTFKKFLLKGANPTTFFRNQLFLHGTKRRFLKCS